MMVVLNKKIIGLTFLLIILSINSKAYAQSTCTIAPLAHNGTGNTGHFAHVRNKAGGGTRYHKGYDANIPPNELRPVPTIMVDGVAKPCDIKKPGSGQGLSANGMPYGSPNPVQGQQFIYNTDPGGYGLYMVFDCGPQIGPGKQMLVRYAHINGFSPSGQVITGRTAIKSSTPHIHVEMALDGTLVDPECMWGTVNENRGCPFEGPANLCGPQYDQMKQDCVDKMGGSNCQSKIPGSGQSTAYGDAKDEPRNDQPHTESDMHTGGGGHDHDGEGDTDPGDTGFVEPGDPIITDGGGSDDVPVIPPPPDVPGNPGDDPDLVPEPKEPATEDELTGCATDTWTAMVNQAVMETRRQDLVNKRFIVKPDSVLDYTCYSGLVEKVAEDAGPIFSETELWGKPGSPREVDILDIIDNEKVKLERNLGSKSLDNALMDVVEFSMINYKRGQFNNAFLAGTASVPNNAGQSYCNVMDQVWKAAKCKNLAGVDVFYTFEELASKDPREFPENMKCD